MRLEVNAAAVLAVLAVGCGGGGGGAGPGPGPGPGPGGGTAFTIETADAASADTGMNPAIAVDYLGTVHVVHLDRANKKFRYARRAGGVWTRSDIASAGTYGGPTYGKFSSIAVDSVGVPAVSYHDADVAYVYAKGNAAGTSWTKTNIPSPGTAYAFMGHNAIAIDPTTDTAHVVNWDYGTNPNETLGYWKPGGSKIAVSGPSNVGSGQLHHGLDCAVAVDSSGWPHISFTSWNGLADSSSKNFMSWAQPTGATTWTVREIEQVPRGWSGVYEEKHSAIALDASDRPHIAYYNGTLDRIRYATWNGTSWTIETVAQPSLNMSALVSVAIAVDASGVPHVAYYGLGNHASYAKRTGAGAWSTEAVDTSSHDTGHGIAIGVDSAGHVHLAYRDDTAGSLKYAVR